MPGVRRDYKVPISNSMDSDVPLVPSRGQAVPRAEKNTHVEVQAIYTDWNTKITSKWKGTIGKLARTPKNPDDQMEGALEHTMKSVENCTHPTRSQPHYGLVYVG